MEYKYYVTYNDFLKDIPVIHSLQCDSFEHAIKCKEAMIEKHPEAFLQLQITIPLK